jgi:tRNA modification GTPase
MPVELAGVLPGAEDTIVAVATAPGRGALAIIRVSGSRANEIAAAVVRPWPLEPGHARWCAAVGPDGLVLDRPVVTVYAAPRSYTGENVVELTTHGGVAAPASIVSALVAAGARPALPGEFTRRAVLNGKMDLAQAEAVGDLIDARSSAMQRSAITHLDGGLSRRVSALRDAVLEVEALVAYDIDFPEEDDGPISRERVGEAAKRASDQVAGLLATVPAGELVRFGAVVVIAGAPNVGKSSLFNGLLGRSRALVSDTPGTTRDAIDALIEPTGAPFPLRLVDTAGLRAGADVLERLGIEVSERALVDAHVVLACGDSEAGIAIAVERIRPHTSAPIIEVWTKCDNGPPPALTQKLESKCHQPPSTALPIVAVSAESGFGLRALLDQVVEVVAARWGTPSPELPLVMRIRQRAALERAAEELSLFRSAWTAGSLPAVVAAVHLQAAASALEEIIGAVGVDDVLDRVFAEFCVGK